MGDAKKLDQFFTQDKIAVQCLRGSMKYIEMLDYDISKISFLEPSAGDGAFVKAAKKIGFRTYCYDIDPKHKYIKLADFLSANLANELPNRSNLITLGNPPFGKRSKLSINFINRAFSYSDTVIFILPLQFMKYSAQSRIDRNARLIYSERLKENSFIFEGSEYSVRCCLQIWTLKEFNINLRIIQSPQTKHSDFQMWQYNNTRAAEKYFDKKIYKWDFAVPRQGYKNYNLRVTNESELDKRTQWIFFKANNSEVLDRLKKIDFTKLSKKNTSTPGFGKADVIVEYDNHL
jgi:predicted RNA methylase